MAAHRVRHGESNQEESNIQSASQLWALSAVKGWGCAWKLEQQDRQIALFCFCTLGNSSTVQCEEVHTSIVDGRQITGELFDHSPGISFHPAGITSSWFWEQHGRCSQNVWLCHLYQVCFKIRSHCKVKLIFFIRDYITVSVTTSHPYFVFSAKRKQYQIF